MALHHEILRDIITGRVPHRFTVSDLKRYPGSGPGRYRVGLTEYSNNAINTIPRNHSVRPDGTSPGDYVQKGRKPAFFWFGGGQYELILDQEHVLESTNQDHTELDSAEGDNEALIRNTTNVGPSPPCPVNVDESLLLRIAECGINPASILVEYLAEQPLQSYHRLRSVGAPVSGWGARLRSYFWPSPDQTWSANSSRVLNISRQIQRALRNLDANSDVAGATAELMEGFKLTCAWGGVRLPESDPECLAKEALCAFRALSDEQEPPNGCRLNSAWTKLYAFALPNTCVIYDSRVAATLTSILDSVMHLLSPSNLWKPYSRLGTVNGRGGTRPRDLRWPWPIGYGRWGSQMAANLLCRNMVDELNRRSETEVKFRKDGDGTRWTLREVEAVLFMEGY